MALDFIVGSGNVLICCVVDLQCVGSIVLCISVSTVPGVLGSLPRITISKVYQLYYRSAVWYSPWLQSSAVGA